MEKGPPSHHKFEFEVQKFYLHTMETDLIIAAIDHVHQKANHALENKDVSDFVNHFDDTLNYTDASGITLSKKQLTSDLQRAFRNIKSYQTSHYRIKSSLENDTFTEKIARKSVLIKSSLLLFTKKQTIQTEEINHWKYDSGEWKIIAVEIVLEEKY